MTQPYWENARRLVGVFLLSLAGGCAIVFPQTIEVHDAWPQGLPERAELVDVPYYEQEEFHCGPASLAMTLADAGVAATPDQLARYVYLPGRRGALQVEMLAAPRRFGVTSYRLDSRLEAVLREVAAGNPVIVLVDFGVWPISIWHYAVIVGYDRAREVAVMRSGPKPRVEIPFAMLEFLWKESDYWSMVTPLAGRVPATAVEDRYADSVAAMARLGDTRAAATAYGALVRRWPASIAGAVGLANAHYSRHELGEAERVLREGLTHHPDSAALLNNLAQTLSDMGRNAEALPLADKAVAQADPLAAAAGETRSLILQRLGCASLDPPPSCRDTALKGQPGG